MKSLSIWDVSLLVESIVYTVFILLVALEFCSIQYAVDVSLGSEIRKTIYLFVLIGSSFRLLSIFCHVFIVLPDYSREFVITMLEESTNLVFVTGLSLQVVFLVQIYYALLGLSPPQIRKIFIAVIMSVYILVFLSVGLGLYIKIEYIIKYVNAVIGLFCLFCLVSLLQYGREIYRNMKGLNVSRNIIKKMIIILSVSSFTFLVRVVIEFLFVTDVIVLDFDNTTNGNMHLIGSHLYASTMYFFFFYFLTEITPLSILLLTTYIRNSAPTNYKKTEVSNSPRVEDKSVSKRSNRNIFKKQPSGEIYQSLLSSEGSSIQMSAHLNSKKKV